MTTVEPPVTGPLHWGQARRYTAREDRAIIYALTAGKTGIVRAAQPGPGGGLTVLVPAGWIAVLDVGDGTSAVASSDQPSTVPLASDPGGWHALWVTPDTDAGTWTLDALPEDAGLPGTGISLGRVYVPPGSESADAFTITASPVSFTAGALGPPGPQGVPGPLGPIGPPGTPGGPAGPQGSAGDPGPVGPVGPEGPRGPAGARGEQGVQGGPGPEGPTGPAGAGVTIQGNLPDSSDLPPTGSPGDAWLINGDLWVWTGDDWENVGNIQGPQGPQGPPGATGAPGADGADGAQGPQGPTGPSGATGQTGQQGPTGGQGPKGDTGPEGPAGATLLLHLSGSWVPGAGGTTSPGTGYFTLTETSDVMFIARIQFPSAVAANYVMTVNVSPSGGGSVQSGALPNVSGAMSGSLVTPAMAAGTYSVTFGIWSQLAQTAQFAWSVTAVALRRAS